ncbi:MAG: zf-HC2 domain-containing protein [Acidobacteria bacterium]|nr:zf-HC2 domain-containing protein [Acidobacteriota bacterium]
MLRDLHCPADVNEIAEAFVMGTLARAEAAVFEEHLLVCNRCTAAAAEAFNYVRTLKIATRRLRNTTARAAGGR